MKTSTPCPCCSKPITLEDFEDFSSPFTMKCPHCRAKLKETKATPYLLAGLVVMILLFIYLAEKAQSFLANYFLVVEKIPTSNVFIGVLYPVYAIYERMNGLIMFNKGNLKLKNKQTKTG